MSTNNTYYIEFLPNSFEFYRTPSSETPFLIIFMLQKVRLLNVKPLTNTFLNCVGCKKKKKKNALIEESEKP
jgi:hypothetical protein